MQQINDLYREFNDKIEALISSSSGKTKKKLKEVRQQVKEFRTSHKEENFHNQALVFLRKALDAINQGK